MTISFTGTIVTRNARGELDAFTMSGYSSFKALVAAFADRARYATLVRFDGVSIEDMRYVETCSYNASELDELISKGV